MHRQETSHRCSSVNTPLQLEHWKVLPSSSTAAFTMAARRGFGGARSPLAVSFSGGGTGSDSVGVGGRGASGAGGAMLLVLYDEDEYCGPADVV